MKESLERLVTQSLLIIGSIPFMVYFFAPFSEQPDNASFIRWAATLAFFGLAFALWNERHIKRWVRKMTERFAH